MMPLQVLLLGGQQKGLCATEDPISWSRCLQGHWCSLLTSCSLDERWGSCQQGGSHSLRQPPFLTPRTSAYMAPMVFAGVSGPAYPKITKGSPLLADANGLRSGGPCGSQGPDPGERHAFDPWSQTEDQKEPNLLFSSFQIYISLGQTAWDHGFCLFIGGRRHPE